MGLLAVVVALCGLILWVLRRNRKRDIGQLGPTRTGVIDDVRKMREQRWKQ